LGPLKGALFLAFDNPLELARLGTLDHAVGIATVRFVGIRTRVACYLANHR
jgi:hypothetical protein